MPNTYQDVQVTFDGAEGKVGKMEGRAIDTIGYRGMHSYEIAFDSWFVAADNQVGGVAAICVGGDLAPRCRACLDGQVLKEVPDAIRPQSGHSDANGVIVGVVGVA